MKGSVSVLSVQKSGSYLCPVKAPRSSFFCHISDVAEAVVPRIDQNIAGSPLKDHDLGILFVGIRKKHLGKRLQIYNRRQNTDTCAVFENTLGKHQDLALAIH